MTAAMPPKVPSAEFAYAEAVEQLRRRTAQRDRWSSRAVFWTAVRFGLEHLHVFAWPAARARWTALWELAADERLPPIPGVPEVENLPSDATAAEREFARMRAIVGAAHVRPPRRLARVDKLSPRDVGASM